MTEFFELHQVIQPDCFWLADPVHIISSQVAQHQVLCSILFRSQKALTKLVILRCGLSSSDRSCDSVVEDLSVFHLTQALWAGPNHLNVAAVEVEHVWARVDSSEMSIDVEGVERCGAGESLTGDGLDDVAFYDMFF